MDSMQCLAMFLFLLLFTTIPKIEGHMRGPHHPRNSPRVDPGTQRDHSHYVPPGRAGHSGQPAPIITHDKNILHDKEHIKEDVGEWVAQDGKEMTPEEMEFHYFKMHDFDNNSLLDGLEILQAISHVMPDDMNPEVPNKANPGPGPSPSTLLKTPEELLKQREDDFNYYIELIDRVLEEDDINKDGYLSYFEYVVGRRREENKEKALHSSHPVQH